MRTIRVHLAEHDRVGEATPATLTLLRSALSGYADSLPVGSVVSIAREKAITRFRGGGVHRGVVCLASRLGKTTAVRAGLDRGPQRIDSWWVSPNSTVAALLLRRKIAPREAARGFGHALRCVAGYYGRSSEMRAYEAYPAAGWGRAESPAVFLLLEEAADADALLDAAPAMLRDAVELLCDCTCARGCGSCTGRHPSTAGRGVVTPDRRAAAALGLGLLGGETRGGSLS